MCNGIWGNNAHTVRAKTSVLNVIHSDNLTIGYGGIIIKYLEQKPLSPLPKFNGFIKWFASEMLTCVVYRVALQLETSGQ